MVGRMERHPRVWFTSGGGSESEWPPHVVSPGIIRGVQDIRLRKLVRYVASRSPYYRTEFERLNLDAKEIRGVGDISRLPLTASDVVEHSDQLLCVPYEEVDYIFTTSGTSRKQKHVSLTKGDFDRYVNLAANAQRLQSSQRPVVMIAQAQGLNSGGTTGQAIYQRAGGLVLMVGQLTPAETFEQMERFRPSALMTSPSHMAALTRAAAEMNFDYKLETISLDGEILTSAQSQRFAEFWGADVLNGYGMTEVGGIGFSLAGCDALHLNEFQTFVEILDPATNAPAEEGEVIATTLVSRTIPLLRYRTGDRCRWATCKCGWRTPAIQFLERLGDRLEVAAANLFAPRIAEAVGELQGVTGSLEVIVDHVQHVDRLTLRIGVETPHALQTETVVDRLFALYPFLRENQRVSCFELNIELVENMRLSPKALRVRDLRE